MTDRITIAFDGWTKVHTWHESHGNGHDDIYQGRGRAGMVTLLTVCHRRGEPTAVRTEMSRHDYLLAAAIRANIGGQYVQDGERSVSSCCTSGYADWRDTKTGDVYRLISVAGHGEYALAL